MTKIMTSLLSFCFLVLLQAGCSDSSKPTNIIQADTFSSVLNCADGISKAVNLGQNTFVRRDVELDLTAPHGFSKETWNLIDGSSSADITMMAGGLSAAYLDGDCWPDIIFAGGDTSGMLAYINQGGQKGFAAQNSLLSGTQSADAYKRFTGIGVADLDGDYSRELVYGNLKQGSVVIKALDKSSKQYKEIDRLPITRSTYGISFGDIDGDGFLDMFLAHWDMNFEEAMDNAPVLWKNMGDGFFIPYDNQAGTSSAEFDQRYNFAAKFVDLRDGGLQDLLVASDFETSAVLKNTGSGVYNITTDRAVIKDQNGMGAALGDINNNGLMDWFVTSIFLESDPLYQLGNRLYVNESNQNQIIFSDVTESAGVADGAWAWAACMADFNHDGFIDIFHVNGFGYIPEALREDGQVNDTISSFIGTISRLFINNGDGTFSDNTIAWGLDVPSEGRGISCFDYDRDGDIDIALVDHSTGIQFFENQIGHGENRRFLNIRVVGEVPNTDAIGTKVYMTADVGGGHGVQRQMRVSEANSNFNSQNLPDIHFGLGSAQQADYLRIEWPDKSGLVCEGVKPNQFLVFDQRDKLWPKEDQNMPNCSWYEVIAQANLG